MASKKDYQLKDHQLAICSPGLWLRLKRQNKIAPSKRKMARRISFFVWASAPLQWLQSLWLKSRIRKVSLEEKPPVFVIGHWRSGTTHLHYLLAQDKQFAVLENFQAFTFRIAFISKSFLKPLINSFMPKKRLQDDVKLNVHLPAEEEQPFTTMTEKSGLHIYFFPKNISYFNKYNLFKGISVAEKADWGKKYVRLLKEIALFQGKEKRLLLKNPHNTGRVKELLELFPDARFIFIHRNPYDVFQSNLHHYHKMVKTQFLQEFSDEEIKERILYCYETTLAKYLEERHLIPKGQLFELSYAELSEAPLEMMAKAYKHLSLPGFEKAKFPMQTYLDSAKDYRRNTFTSLSADQKEELERRWGFTFDAWGYEKEH
jgi:hypothetical protein